MNYDQLLTKKTIELEEHLLSLKNEEEAIIDSVCRVENELFYSKNP